jgi:hypothetical protein
MMKKIQAAFFSLVVVSGIVLAVAIIHRFPFILVGLLLLAIFSVIYDIVYRNMD